MYSQWDSLNLTANTSGVVHFRENNCIMISENEFDLSYHPQRVLCDQGVHQCDI